MLTWELIGAVVGAGLASGREIAAFFTRYGVWSFAGIILSISVMIYLADTQIPRGWLGKWPEKMWHILLTLLLIVTGGAMLSGAGEIAVLTIPVQGAYHFGLLGTLTLSWILANRTVSGLAWVSKILLSILAVLIVLGLTLSPMKAVIIYEENWPEALIRGLTYGGFNAALQAPIIATALGIPNAERKRAAKLSGFLVLFLLTLGNAVLLRHSALIFEPMPFLKMMTEFRKTGYWLGAISLYLAILSTLTACMRGINGRILPAMSILFVSFFGFTGVVDIVYPILGGGCFLMLFIAKITNSFEASFHSRTDML